MTPAKRKNKPKLKRYTVAIGDNLLPQVEAIQSHYGQQTISETIRFLVWQGVNQEMSRQIASKNADNMKTLKDFNETIRQMMENPALSGILDQDTPNP